MPDDDYRGGESSASGSRTLRDAYKRDIYKKKIEEVSRRALDEVKAAREARDVDAARQAARRALDERNALRTATQEELSWSGRKFSQAVEQPRNWSRQIMDAERKVLKINPAATEYDVYEAIARSAGKSNTTMGPLQAIFKGLGYVAVGVGAVLILKNVWDAPPGEKLNVLGREAVGLGIGFGASALGSTAMVTLLKAFGVAAAGPLAVGAIIGGLGLALLADWAYRKLGEKLGGRDPFAALLGALAGLLIGTAYGMPAPASLWNCDCGRVEFGLLTKEFQADCRRWEAKLKTATTGCGGDLDCIRQKLKLKAGPNQKLVSGEFCGSNSGPFAWPVQGGPTDPPPRPPDEKPCTSVSGLARRCD